MNSDNSINSPDEQPSSKRQRIQPRTLKVFRDYVPESMIPRERLLGIARKAYRSYGFSPIDTPTLEYLEILTGKGSDETDRQLYRFEDHGGRSVGMRFDLTVPLARFVAQHINTLGTPFKRYHIAPVWRGENTQRGRYREFMQCDFDTIGTLSVAADIETGLVINDLFEEIGFDRFTIHINNRQVLTGLLEQIGVASQATAILRSLDKLAKIGPERTAQEMVKNAEITAQQADQVLAITTLSGSNQEILENLKPLVDKSELGTSGIERLQQILDGLAAGGVAPERIKLDVSIARGLDYYTGVIFETFLDDLPEIGSVCSGGRYDNLAELYTKQQLPGIGASLGLDRLLTAMDELGMIDKVKTPADILVVHFEKDQLNKYLEIAANLRQAGWKGEVFPDAKKMGKQLKYADVRGFQYALIAGGDELQRNVCQIKNLQTGESVEYPLLSVATDMK